VAKDQKQIQNQKPELEQDTGTGNQKLEINDGNKSQNKK
jgi:hypothetical protein